jgi:hypothetical protein
MSEAIVPSLRSRASAWARACAALLFVYALSGAFLQFIKLSGGLPPVLPVAILATLAIAVGVAILLTGDRRLAAAAAALLVIALIGTTPHDIENLDPANGLGQRIYGAADMAVMWTTLAVAVVAFFKWKAPEAS